MEPRIERSHAGCPASGVTIWLDKSSRVRPTRQAARAAVSEGDGLAWKEAFRLRER